MLHAAAPPQSEEPSLNVVDLPDPEDSELPPLPKKEPESEPVAPAAWHGTLLPNSDAEIWLTTAFANYERIVAQEKASLAVREERAAQSRRSRPTGPLPFRLPLRCTSWGAGRQRRPPGATRSNLHDDNWYKVASGKGVLLLHSLRGLLGADDFDRRMDEFGRAHAGTAVTVAQFQTYLEEKTGRSLQAFFDAWLNRTGLPRLELARVRRTAWERSGRPRSRSPR